MAEKSYRGGAQIGWVGASWPVAQLPFNRDRLTLACLDTYEFSPSEIVSVEPTGSGLLSPGGIRFHHNRADYPEKMVFHVLGSKQTLLKELNESGFLPSGQPVARAPGFALRWSVIIAAAVLWNCALLLEPPGGHGSRQLHFYPLLPVLLAFSVATLARTSHGFQRLILREGHQIGEIRIFLKLLQLVTGVISLGLGAALVFQGHGG